MKTEKADISFLSRLDELLLKSKKFGNDFETKFNDVKLNYVVISNATGKSTNRTNELHVFFYSY
jgi:hypothetical protein